MFARFPKLFRFESQHAQRDRLRHTFRPRLEWLEDRLAPAITVTPPAAQMSTEGAPNSFALGSFNDSAPPVNFWTVDVNWGDNSSHTRFNTTVQGNLPNVTHVYGEEGSYTATVTVSNVLSQSGQGSF